MEDADDFILGALSVVTGTCAYALVSASAGESRSEMMELVLRKCMHPERVWESFVPIALPYAAVVETCKPLAGLTVPIRYASLLGRCWLVLVRRAGPSPRVADQKSTENRTGQQRRQVTKDHAQP